MVVNNANQEADHRSKGYIGEGEPVPDAIDYQEFPKQLSHKEFEPILVNDAGQQADAEAKGYFEPVLPDPRGAADNRAVPYNPNQRIEEWPKMVDGVLMYDPETIEAGPVEYPKAVTPPNGGEQVIVQNRAEEKKLRASWGLITKTAAPEKEVPETTKLKSAARSEKMKAAWAKRKAAAAQAGA